MPVSDFDQAEFEVRCEWGLQGVARLAPISDAIIIIDILSFSTCVEIAVSCGASVLPYRWRDDSAQQFAASIGAQLAGARGSRYSLSPASLIKLNAGEKLVLPSPNGATLSLATGATPTLIGCLRNYEAVAHAASQHGARIAVIPAGEQWEHSSALRPAFEDLIGAGAVISQLAGTRSPEARAALAAWNEAKSELPRLLAQCGSGRELIARGYAEDVTLASQIAVSACAPVLVKGAFVRQ